MNYNYILVFKFETGNKSSFVWLVYIMFFEIIIIYSFSICNRFIISFKNNIVFITIEQPKLIRNIRV